MVRNNHNNSGPNDPLKEHQWKPGQSGNPKGRPKTDSVTRAIRSLLADGISGEPLYEAIAKVAVQKALQGDRHFWQFVVDRSDGKVLDQVNQSGEVEVTVRYEEPGIRED